MVHRVNKVKKRKGIVHEHFVWGRRIQMLTCGVRRSSSSSRLLAAPRIGTFSASCPYKVRRVRWIRSRRSFGFVFALAGWLHIRLNFSTGPLHQGNTVYIRKESDRIWCWDPTDDRRSYQKLTYPSGIITDARPDCVNARLCIEDVWNFRRVHVVLKVPACIPRYLYRCCVLNLSTDFILSRTRSRTGFCQWECKGTVDRGKGSNILN